MALSLYDQLRAAHVRRWHIVQVCREQTLAEHSFNVATLSGALAARMRWPGLMDNTKKLKLMHWAMMHDLIEVNTGDIPTPFKSKIREAAGNAGVLEDAESLVDNEHMGHYRAIKGTEVEMIVDLADVIEAIFFLQDNGIGLHAKKALDGIRVSLADLVNRYEAQYPELDIRTSVRGVCNDIGIMGGWL